MTADRSQGSPDFRDQAIDQLTDALRETAVMPIVKAAPYSASLDVFNALDAHPAARAALARWLVPDQDVEIMRQALHEQGIGCKPNVVHCHATHKGHANRLVSSIHAIRESGSSRPWPATLSESPKSGLPRPPEAPSPGAEEET